MKKYNFSGNYYEIGSQLGNVIKGSFQLPPASKSTIEFARECRIHVKKYAPGVLDELQGLSEATGFESDLLDAFVLALGKDIIDQMRVMVQQGIDFGCSALALSGDYTGSGRPIFARNYDWSETFQEYFTVIWNTPKGGIANISFTDHIVGRYGGMNSEGLAMCIHGIPNYEKDWSPGLRMNVITRWVLDNFKNTKEAVDYLEKVPHICGHNYLIGDKYNQFARIETAGDEVVVSYAKDGFMTTTNHFITEKLKKYVNQKFTLLNSYERLDKLTAWCENDNVEKNLTEVRKLFSGHDSGVCNHFELAGDKTSTIWSWIAELGTNEILVCDGSPCIGEYERFKL